MPHFLMLTVMVVAFGLVMLPGCSTVVKPQRAAVVFVKELDGTYQMTSKASAQTYDVARREAELNALEILMFRGLPGSQQRDPMIGPNEAIEKQKAPDYFQALYDDDRYRTFITDVQDRQSIKDSNEGVSVEILVTINIRALRRDLENNNIVRKLGW